MFNENESFAPGSVARDLAQALARAGEVLTAARPGWQHSPQARAELGLTPEFGDAFARNYLDFCDSWAAVEAARVD